MDWNINPESLEGSDLNLAQGSSANIRRAEGVDQIRFRMQELNEASGFGLSAEAQTRGSSVPLIAKFKN